jgi:hypothetical protein
MTAIQPIESFLARLQHSFEDGSFVRLVLSGASRETPVKLTARLIELQGRPVLSVSRQQGAANTTSNHPASEATAWVRGQLREHFRSALLNTTRGDWQLHLPANGAPRLVKHKPTFRAAPTRTHDETAHQILDASAHDWLHGLGVTDASGRARAAMTDKHRQINRYVEILSHLARDCGWLPTDDLSYDRSRAPELGEQE